jgi:SET domain-containing protein
MLLYEPTVNARSRNYNSGNLSIGYIEGKGRGVFAQKHFARGEAIECAPVIVLPDDPWELLNRTSLKDHYLTWGEQACAIALGFGSLYNYSYVPNAVMVRHLEEAYFEMVALRDIEAGEEITFKYNCPPWFEVKE